jgi:hypothetical protein
MITEKSDSKMTFDRVALEHIDCFVCVNRSMALSLQAPCSQQTRGINNRRPLRMYAPAEVSDTSATASATDKQWPRVTEFEREWRARVGDGHMNSILQEHLA